MEKKNNPPESRCARCAAPFTCGLRAGEENCWCSGLPPLVPLPGRDCLCRRCLADELSKVSRPC
jgi:hypothetical protein